MTATLALVSYALVTGTMGAHLLRQARWADRSPRLGIVAWQALTWSLLTAVILAGLTLAIPVWPVSADLAGLLRSCATLLSNQYATTGGATVSTVALALVVLVLVRVGHAVLRAMLEARSGRRRQRNALALVARRDDRLGALVVEHPSCAAYCIPGGRGEVVLTSTTVASLDADQLACVLAHERAHLRGRHDLVIALAAGMHAAFPFVPALRYAKAEVSRLLEMVADDAAAGSNDRITLATALIRLAEGAVPAGTLGAGGDSAVARVRRLAAPSNPLGRIRMVLTLSGVAVLAVTPVLLAAAPALAVSLAGYCPVGFPT